MTVPRRAGSGSVDWAEVRRRIEVARETSEGGSALSPERAREILEARARELAAAAPERASPMLEVITFSLAGQTYAIELRYVTEVFRLNDLAFLPGAEAPTVGLTGWRGRLLTILDLRQILGLPAGASGNAWYVVVLGAERPAYGILADRVHEVVALAVTDVRSPQSGMAVSRKYVRGLAGDALPVLDGTELLSVGEVRTDGESRP